MITNLLGTPSPSEMRTCAPGAVRYVESSRKEPALTALYSLSQDVTHEAVHLMCQMLMFDPVSVYIYVDKTSMTCVCNCLVGTAITYPCSIYYSRCWEMNFQV